MPGGERLKCHDNAQVEQKTGFIKQCIILWKNVYTVDYAALGCLYLWKVEQLSCTPMYYIISFFQMKYKHLVTINVNVTGVMLGTASHPVCHTLSNKNE